MSDLSSVLTTSFHTHLSFLDEENDDSLLEGEDEEDGDEYGEEYNNCGPSGSYWCVWVCECSFQSYLIEL